jgi:hypothetical protein
MKTIIMLSMLLLTTVSVNSQTRDRSGNRKENGNTSNSSKTERKSDNNGRDKHISNDQTASRMKQSSYSTRTSNNSHSENTRRGSTNIGPNEITRVRNSDLAANNNGKSRSVSEVSERRERNTINKNERSGSSELNSNMHSNRNTDRQFVSGRNYIPDSRHETSDSRHFNNNNYMSHHTRIEHWEIRGHGRFHHFEPISVRRIRFPFIIPRLAGLIWSLELRNEYFLMYPEFHIREYNYGYRIPNISAYDAGVYVGEIATVYGNVIETEYSVENDEYYLYIGQEFPNQDFSVVVPGNLARRMALWPEKYFQGANITITGLITSYNNKPEIVVKRSNQIDRY